MRFQGLLFFLYFCLSLFSPSLWADAKLVVEEFPELYYASLEVFESSGLPEHGIPSPLALMLEQKKIDESTFLRLSRSPRALSEALAQDEKLNSIYRQVSGEVGRQACETFFAFFELQEIRRFRRQFYRSLEILQKFYFRAKGISTELDDPKLTPELIAVATPRFKKRIEALKVLVRSELGEAFGTGFLKAQAKRHQVMALDEATYKYYNSFGKIRNLPDGLLYSLMDGNLYIHSIMESKMTSAALLDHDQAFNYLRKWRGTHEQMGLRVLTENGVPLKFYGPDIFFLPLDQIKHPQKAIPLEQMLESFPGKASEKFFTLVTPVLHAGYAGQSLVPMSFASANNIGHKLSAMAHQHCRNEYLRYQIDKRRSRRLRRVFQTENQRRLEESLQKQALFKKLGEYKKRKRRLKSNSWIRILKAFKKTFLFWAPWEVSHPPEIDPRLWEKAQRDRRDEKANHILDRERNLRIEKLIKRRQYRRDHGTGHVSLDPVRDLEKRSERAKPRKPRPKTSTSIHSLMEDSAFEEALNFWMLSPQVSRWPRKNYSNQTEYELHQKMQSLDISGQAHLFIHFLKESTQLYVAQEALSNPQSRKIPAKAPFESALISTSPFQFPQVVGALKAFQKVYETETHGPHSDSAIVQKLRSQSPAWAEFLGRKEETGERMAQVILPDESPTPPLAATVAETLPPSEPFDLEKYTQQLNGWMADPQTRGWPKKSSPHPLEASLARMMAKDAYTGQALRFIELLSPEIQQQVVIQTLSDPTCSKMPALYPLRKALLAADPLLGEGARGALIAFIAIYENTPSEPFDYRSSQIIDTLAKSSPQWKEYFEGLERSPLGLDSLHEQLEVFKHHSCSLSLRLEAKG